jgi:hypothetical protein
VTLCKYCEHYRRILFFMPTCARIPKQYSYTTTDPVSGRTRYMGNRTCGAQRFNSGIHGGYEYCGPSGKHWEAADRFVQP